jgi:hypothetical protein
MFPCFFDMSSTFRAEQTKFEKVRSVLYVEDLELDVLREWYASECVSHWIHEAYLPVIAT